MKMLKKVPVWIYIILIVLLLVVFNIITSNKEESGWENIPENNSEKETYMLGATVDDGRVIHFTFDVPYI